MQLEAISIQLEAIRRTCGLRGRSSTATYQLKMETGTAWESSPHTSVIRAPK